MPLRVDKPFPTAPHALMTDDRPFGERLKHWREQRGLDVECVAELLSVSARDVARWEKGTAPEDPGRLYPKLKAAQRDAGELRSSEPDPVEHVRALWAEYRNPGLQRAVNPGLASA